MKDMKEKLLNEQIDLKLKLVIIVFIALMWFSIYYLNDWLFTHFVFIQDVINWVFLPAAVRLFAVLLAGWLGVIGLYLGSIATSIFLVGSNPTDLHIFVFATISSTTPMLALMLCTWGLKINNNLQGLSASNLFVLCAAVALLNVFPHNLAYYYFGHVNNFSDGIVPMFVGDFIGMFIVLYLVRLTLLKKPKLHNQLFS
jgi:hypothetical protein